MRVVLIALVFLGGGIGSVLRYLLGAAIQSSTQGAFPAGTFTVNVLGCAAVGFVGTLGLERAMLPPELRVFLMAGVLGGFTTFSAFAFEAFSLVRLRDLLTASLYLGASVFAGLLGVFLGRTLGRAL